MYKRNRKKRRRGFTLIELLVVVGIIGLLSSMLMASLNSSRIKARDSARIQSMKQVQIALNLYFDDIKTFPGVNNTWYDMECDTTSPPDGIYTDDFDTILPTQYMAQTPRPLANVCIWYQPRQTKLGYRIMFIPEQTSLYGDGDGCNTAGLEDYYCIGANW